MTQSKTMRGARSFRPAGPAMRALALTVAAVAAASCERTDEPGLDPQAGRSTASGAGQATANTDGTSTVRVAIAQRQEQETQPGQQARQPAGDQPGDVSRQVVADPEATIELGTFSPTIPASEPEEAQGRLPARGDLTIYVPNTTLFPGSARLDPGIENPYRGDPDAIAAGERHFNAFNCSGCHAPLGGGGMGPPLSDDGWIHGSEPAQIFLTIMHGRPEGMPAFGSMIPRRTAWELAAYIETLDEIDNYAAHLGFDAEHSTSTSLASRDPEAQSDSERRIRR